MLSKVIYVCSQLKGDKEGNMEKAAVYSKKVMELGHIPYTPHLMFTHFINEDEPAERNKALAMGLEMMEVCNELWVFGRVITEGMAAEILRARKLGIPVYYKNVNLLEMQIAANKKQPIRHAA